MACEDESAAVAAAVVVVLDAAATAGTKHAALIGAQLEADAADQALSDALTALATAHGALAACMENQGGGPGGENNGPVGP